MILGGRSGFRGLSTSLLVAAMTATTCCRPGPATAQDASPATVAPVAPDATAARLEELEKTVAQLTGANGRDLRDTGLPLHGFASIGWAQIHKASPGTRDGFAVGSLDFYLTPEFGSNVKTLVELNFETEGDGETVIDLERAQIGYTFSDRLTLWVGRFHTPFGYWNLAFHHGGQLQTSILRPRLLDFEDDGGILPVHTVGAMGVGSLRLGTGKLVYNVYAGNATRIVDGLLNPNAGGDDSGAHLLGFSLAYRFSGTLDGLSLGAHGLREQVGAYDTAGAQTSRTRLGMLGTYAVYDEGGWELIGEYYRLRNTDLSGTGGAHTSWTGYAQVGRVLNERWIPYFRVEKAVLNAADNYFAAQVNGHSYTRHLAGLRFNVDTRSALKVEVNRTRDASLGAATDELRLQYAVSF